MPSTSEILLLHVVATILYAVMIETTGEWHGSARWYRNEIQGGLTLLRLPDSLLAVRSIVDESPGSEFQDPRMKKAGLWNEPQPSYIV